MCFEKTENIFTLLYKIIFNKMFDFIWPYEHS